MILPAEKFQFGRSIREYARWIADNEFSRLQAPGWWWGPAFFLRDAQDMLPSDLAAMMRLPEGATYAQAAQLFLATLSGQIYQPWPDEFTRRYGSH
jgi:hypothetical protein